MGLLPQSGLPEDPEVKLRASEVPCLSALMSPLRRGHGRREREADEKEEVGSG